jgi:hypothetical protein
MALFAIIEIEKQLRLRLRAMRARVLDWPSGQGGPTISAALGDRSENGGIF